MSGTTSIFRALRRGQKLARSGRLDESLAAFDAAGEPKHFQLSLHHALALARAGQGDAALEKAAAAVAAAPADGVPALFHAYLLLRAGRLDAAEAEIERARTLTPANPILPSLSAALAVLRGDVVRGCRALLEGPVTDNLDILGWIVGTVERKVFEAVGTDSGAIPPAPEDDGKRDVPPDTVPELSAGACSKRGQRLFESGKPRTALKYLARAAELKPDDPEHRTMYGAALFENGAFDRAEAELSRAPEKGPLAGVAQFYRAANSYRLGRFDQALGLLDTLPMVGDAFLFQEWCSYIRGMTLVALDRVDEAGPHLAAFIDAEPAVIKRRMKKAIEVLGGSDACST